MRSAATPPSTVEPPAEPPAMTDTSTAATPFTPDLMDAAASDPQTLGWMQGAPPPPERQVRFDDGGMYTFPKLRWA